MSTFTERLLGAAKLKESIYEEVKLDTDATRQAMMVVILATLAAGIGQGVFGTGGLAVWVTIALFSLCQWVIWAFLIYIIGTRFLPEPQMETNVGQIMRTLGFAASPGLLRILGVLPLSLGVSPWVVLIPINIWCVLAMVVAVRLALNYETPGRAMVVCVLAFMVALLVAVLLLAVVGPDILPTATDEVMSPLEYL